jgi:4-hydroxy-tetrahydrodipicolinate reductase
MAPIKLGLIGSAGRMGAALRQHLETVDDIVLHCTLEQDEPAARMIDARPDIVIDLSLGRAVDEHGPAIAAAGLAYIIGATGYQAATIARLREAIALSGAPVLVVPNFSIGANLMLRFAASAAKLMQSPVITERHHAGKADAPSGTARYTAERIAQARAGMNGAAVKLDSTAENYSEHAPHVLGGIDHGIPLHSIRGAGYLAEQEVRLCLPGEALIIEHRSIDRRCFMPGIVYAIRNISRVVGLVIGLDTILDI